MTQKINRRKFLKQSAGSLAALGLASPFLSAPAIASSKISNKIFVLGIDGMDPILLKKFMRRGEMPTFEKMQRKGYFGPLKTTIPPQSPVAWSSFISGSNPGVHGIFDFIHRDPETFLPFLSTSRSYGAEKSITVGDWTIPIKGGHVDMLRKGPVLWDVLEANNIPATFYKLPANFPVVPSQNINIISGMGTPDLLGTYGTFTFFAEGDVPFPKDAAGGRLQKVDFSDHKTQTIIKGPVNSMRADQQPTEIELLIHRDPWKNTVILETQGERLLLKKGEWTEWVPLTFEMMPLIASVHGMVRFYVQDVHPFRLYMSPINIDPENPHVPISTPPSLSRDVAKAIGRYYTQGFPEDTKALSHGVFSDEEFLSQSQIVFEERLHAFNYELNTFKEGLFFFYFSSIDQNTHMMWHNMDPKHHLYDKNRNPDVKDAVYHHYRNMDDILRQTLDKMDSKSTLIILSDHGFAPFDREFQLSTWLAENNWTGITDKDKVHESTFYDYVDWDATKAYAMGLNGIYINLYGREFNGTVFPEEYEKTKKEMIHQLEKIRDPMNGKRIIARAYDAKKVYQGPNTEIGPDIIVGYERGYRISNEAVLGKFPKGLVNYRTDKWAADHCMAPHLVPGVLITNKEVKSSNPGIWDLAPSIIQQFGLEPAQQMDGKSIYI